MIYFIQAGENGPIKIGWTKDALSAEIRLKNLQVGNHENLEIMRVIGGRRSDEYWIQEMFKDLHINGEWYKPSDTLIKFVKTSNPIKSANWRGPIG